MNDKKLSIIVPVYNVEDYIDKCLESIVNQTYRNLEIILVEDGATDKCPQICDEWESKDERIKVIHKQNGGLASARNSGIEEATGEYMAFVDSDDWLEVNVYEKIIKLLEESQANVAVFGMTKIDEQGKVLSVHLPDKRVIEGECIEKEVFGLIADNFYGYAWNKVYRSDIIKKSGIRNNPQIIDREDLAFNLEIMPFLDKIVCVDVMGYYYLQRGTSLLHIKSLKRLEGISAFCNFMNDFKMNNSKEKERIYNYCVKQYVSDCIIKNILWNTGLAKNEKVEKMNEIFSNVKIGEKLVKSKNDPRYLKALSKSFSKKNYKSFYTFFLLSEIKRKVLLFIRVKI